MRNMVISLALGAGAIFASPAADAAPLTKGLAMLPNDNIENVRLVCVASITDVLLLRRADAFCLGSQLAERLAPNSRNCGSDRKAGDVRLGVNRYRKGLSGRLPELH